MAGLDRKELILVVGAIVTFVATLIGLVADISEVSKSPVGQFILLLILSGAFFYLAYFIYIKALRAYKETKKQLDEIKDMIVKFTSSNANSQIQGCLDLDLINLLIATKKMKKYELGIKELRHLPNNRIKIVIDKGHKHGLMDRMNFKVFHDTRLEELGSCGCTSAHDEATLIIEIGPNCPIALHDIEKGSIEIRLIDPLDTSKVNTLLADLLYELDYKD